MRLRAGAGAGAAVDHGCLRPDVGSYDLCRWGCDQPDLLAHLASAQAINAVDTMLAGRAV
ncbi:MAG: hypothetical protein ACLVJ6_14890 [Merdibacter sp.]